MNDLPPEIDAKLDDQYDRDLARKISFGFGVKDFLKSEFGRQIAQRDEAERVTLVEELAITDADTTDGLKRNRELRARIATIDHWQDHLAEYIGEGEVAEKEFTARNEH